MLKGLAQKINPKRLAKNMLLAFMSPKVEGLCERLRAQFTDRRLEHIVANRMFIWEQFTPGVIAALFDSTPDQIDGFRRTYGWAERVIADEDMTAMFPDWLRQMIARHGEAGEAWRKELSIWIRRQFHV